MVSRSMNLDALLPGFSQNPTTLCSFLEDLSPDQIVWRPKPKAWSILEVVNHLLDEEREDFRVRLEYTLHRSGESWPPIDPEGWVIERDYNSRNLKESLKQFCAEREKSVAWLRGLTTPDWTKAYEHPRTGKIKTGDLMLSWVAHDYLHFRQLARLRLEYAGKLGAPYSYEYAG